MKDRQRCAHWLAALFGFWLSGVLLSVQVMDLNLSRPQPTQSYATTSVPSIQPMSTTSVALRVAELQAVLAVKNEKMRRLATRLRVLSEPRMESANTTSRSTDAPPTTLSTVADSVAMATRNQFLSIDEFLTSRLIPRAHASAEHFREFSQLRARYVRSVIDSGASVDRRHSFCLGDVPWCYAPVPRAPPLPPADTDDLSWLEVEYQLAGAPLVYFNATTLVPPSVPAPQSMLFTLTPGRSGTRFFKHALGIATNVSCFHPPAAGDRPLSSHDPIRCGVDFHESKNASHAHRHLVKAGSLVSILNHFRMPPTWHYCEVNPVTVKQWSDVLVGSPLLREHADRPTNLIVLRRNMARTAKSMIEAGWFTAVAEPPGTPVGEQRCARMLYEAHEPVAFLARCSERNGRPDGERWDVFDRVIAHLFDVEARTQALVRRALRLEAARRAAPLVGASARAADTLRGATDARVFEVCLEQLSAESMTRELLQQSADGTLDDMVGELSQRAVNGARKNVVSLLADMGLDPKPAALESVTTRTWGGEALVFEPDGSVDLTSGRQISIPSLTVEYVQQRIDEFRERCANNGVVLPAAPHSHTDGCRALNPLPPTGARVLSPHQSPYNQFPSVTIAKPSAAVLHAAPQAQFNLRSTTSSTTPTTTSTTTTTTTTPTTTTTTPTTTSPVLPRESLDEPELRVADAEADEVNDYAQDQHDMQVARFFEQRTRRRAGTVPPTPLPPIAPQKDVHERYVEAMRMDQFSTKKNDDNGMPSSRFNHITDDDTAADVHEQQQQAMRMAQFNEHRTRRQATTAPSPPTTTHVRLPFANLLRGNDAVVPPALGRRESPPPTTTSSSSSTKTRADAVGMVHNRAGSPMRRDGRANDHDIAAALADLQEREHEAVSHRSAANVRRAFDRFDELAQQIGEGNLPPPSDPRLRGRAHQQPPKL